MGGKSRSRTRGIQQILLSGLKGLLICCLFVLLLANKIAYADGFTIQIGTNPPPTELPGQKESCKVDPPIPDFDSKCPLCMDVELQECSINISDDPARSVIRFKLYNHNSIYTRSVISARWGHVGINPAPGGVGSGATGKRPNGSSFDADSDPTLDDYPLYKPDNAVTQAVPNAIGLKPKEKMEYEQWGVIDHPAFKACGDVAFMAIQLEGLPEEPFLWNRNFSCDIRPCKQLNFRRCTVTRGGVDQPAKTK